MDNLEYKLTHFSKSSGCGCKIAPDVLAQIIAGNKNFVDEKLIVGNTHNDDAAVYQLTDKCLISTTDFFMPVVDDAFDYGQIAAANALSDVYAMGGKPILALAILGWPVNKLPVSLAQQVLAGARKACNSIAISLAGGHSIDSTEPFFGLTVNGLVANKNLKKNRTANPGDLLFITKPIGNGMITAAYKRNLIATNFLQQAIKSMCQINSLGYELGRQPWVTALTDVTGFGLLGHCIEMANASNLSIELLYNNINCFDGVATCLQQFVYPDMTTKNFQSYQNQVTTLTAEQLLILCDPQTNGGLLIAVDAAHKQDYIELAKSNGLDEIFWQPIGSFTARKEKTIHVL
ncbi:MAG: selenide, water dikinase SelD [Bacteroidia bacterium]|nr:selenide, water dikinase SelD [Bacteroidia bacterium]